MSFWAVLKSVLQTQNIQISERKMVTEISFELTNDHFPAFEQINHVLELFPKRDEVTICFVTDAEDFFNMTNYGNADESAYNNFVAEIGDFSVNVMVKIDKKVSDNKFSIYSFEKFAEDLIQTPLADVMASFSLILRDCEYLICEMFDESNPFTTGTMAFIPAGDNATKAINRKKTLKNCRDASFFYDINTYEILPDDFAIDTNYVGNPLSGLFEKLMTALSLAYIGNSAHVEQDALYVSINGQRNINYPYKFNEGKTNDELFRIYHWIYTDGNSVDKAIIARNVISLNCLHSDLLINIDERVFASIQTNYGLSLKNNVTQYLELKNKLSDFICDVVAKTGEYSTALLAGFKKNLLAIFVFFLGTILPKIISGQDLTNIFTKDITSIIEIILIGSVLYLVLCIFETCYKWRKAKKSYSYLKDNYKSIFDPNEINVILNDDMEFKTVSKSVICGIILWSAVWFVALCLLLYCVETIGATDSLLKTFFKQ